MREKLSRSQRWVLVVLFGMLAFLTPPPFGWIIAFLVGWEMGELIWKPN